MPAETPDKEPEESEHQTVAEASFEGFIEICDELERSRKVVAVSSVSIFEKHRISNHIVSEFPDSVSGFGQSWIRIGTKTEPRNRRFMLKQIRSEHGYHYLLHVERRVGPCKQTNRFSDHFAIYVFSAESTKEVTSIRLDALLRDLSEASFRHYKMIFNVSGFSVSIKKHTTSADRMATAILKKLSNQ